MARTIFALIITALIPLAAYAGNAALLQAAHTNNSTSIQALLGRGVDPDSRSENSATVLIGLLALIAIPVQIARLNRAGNLQPEK